MTVGEHTRAISNFSAGASPAGKLVILRFDGTHQQGFRVWLEIGNEGDRPFIELAGALPPNLKIATYLLEWQQHYRSLSANQLENSRIQPQQILYGGSVNRLDDCWHSATKLQQQMIKWLASPSFRHLDLRLRESLSPSDPIRLLIRTQDPLLRRLPWHLWDFVERYTKTEIALSAPVFERIAASTQTTRRRGVNILAVLGNSKDIDVQTDRQFLAALPNANVTFLVEPARAEIDRHLWEQPWDILFFAGHSFTKGDRGLVCINPNESLSLEELRYSLKQAISKDLQLAIFNSCDGLGLARSLESLHLPQMIVMREPVPDRVAQTFLKNFLTAFSNGKSLYLSMREAREQLQSIEDQFPCATWLPIICQNPADPPPTWQSLAKDSNRSRSNPAPDTLAPPASAKVAPSVRSQIHTQRQPRLSLQTRRGWIVLFISLLVTVGLTRPFALRQIQPLELSVYDRLMQLRPREGTDDRLLIISITEDDVRTQKENGEQLKRRSLSAQSYNQTFDTSLSDSSLYQLLASLEQYQPRVIGLDIYRDFAALPEQKELASRLQQDSTLVAVCKAEDFEDPSIPSIDPPPEVPPSRIGFSDFREDRDSILRRHLLGMLPLLNTSTSRCNTEWSFSAQIAAQYLRQQQLEVQFTEPGDLQLGDRLIHILRSQKGSYPPNAGGSEILLNYRATEEIAPMLTLQQFLNQQPNPDYLRDKVVLIGINRQDGEDLWTTPTQPDTSTPGIIVQAHAVSQLLSAALDNRPIISTLSRLQQTGWILTWAIAGGLLGLWKSPQKQTSHSIFSLSVKLASAIAFLYGLCFLSLLRGHWLPFASLALALVLSSILITVCSLNRFSNRTE